MGPGWSLGGFSQISRCPNTYAQNGVALGINFTSTDRFCLDGQQLVTNGPYGAVGTEYRTEIESFNKIVSVGGGLGFPAYFILKSKSGLTITYGQTYTVNKGAGYTYLWLLDSTTDTSGNTIQYTYTVSGGDWWPATITYGGNTSAGTPASVAVTFTWEARPDYTPTGYLAGLALNHNKHLSRIDTSVGGNPVRHWGLGYVESANRVLLVGTRDVLASVTECVGPDNTQCANPTQFGWNSPTSTFTNQAMASPNVVTNSFFPPLVGDIDGDGRSDLLGATVGGSQGTLTLYWDTASSMLNGGSGTSQTISGSYLPGTFFANDFNGDGLTDMALASVDNNGNELVQVFTFSNGSFHIGASTSQAIPSTQNLSGSVTLLKPVVGDLNGDGLPDILWLICEGFQCNYNTFVSSASNPGALNPGPSGTFTFSGAVVYGAYAVDLNGDGAVDIALLGRTSSGATNILTFLNSGQSHFPTTPNYSAQIYNGFVFASIFLLADFTHKSEI